MTVKRQLQMYDADVKVMPRRADGGAMSGVGGWGSRKDVGMLGWERDRRRDQTELFLCLRACVRMRMLSIYLFNQFSTLIVVLSFGPECQVYYGPPAETQRLPCCAFDPPRPPRAAQALPPRCVRAQLGETCCGAFRSELKWLRTRTSVCPSVRRVALQPTGA